MNNAIAISRYILHRTEGRRLHQQKLFKLLFLIDVFAAGNSESDKSVCGLRYIAAPRGPVPVDHEGFLGRLEQSGFAKVNGEFLEASVHEREGSHVFSEQVPTIENLRVKDYQAIDDVLHHYGPLSVDDLSDASHEFPAWLLTPKGQEIEPELLQYSVRLGDVTNVNPDLPSSGAKD